MNYDTWKTTEPESYAGGGQSRLAEERAWWQCFTIARREGRVEEYLAEYDGHSLYVVLVEDARRLLEAGA